MSIFNKAKDKAKGMADSLTETVNDFSSDELIASTIMKAVEKQEKVNVILKREGSIYRVADIDLQVGIPPTISFGVRRIQDDGE
ncbi:MAG: hypothetical protein Q9M28_08885 [Mariprofundaceae bacterium]|nr:hypothetical protein [Mariprofundaceae bacterium]